MSSLPTDGVLVDVVMPQLGVSVVEGTLVGWRVGVGDVVAADDVVCEVSTDKVDSEVPAPCEGRVVEVLVGVGETVAVGAVLGRVLGSGTGAGGGGTAELGERRRRYSPVVLRIAAAHGVDLEGVEGTGRGGRVRKQDVLGAVARMEARGSAAAGEAPLHSESPYRAEVVEREVLRGGSETAPLGRMRTAIGEHMRRSLDTAAHCTTIVEVDMSRVEVVRRRLGLTYLPVVARCVVEVLGEFPALNATLEGELLTGHAEVHLGVAVSLGEDGLVVPVVHGAQALSVEELGARIVEVAARARGGELTADEVRGGTFTITNPGAFGAVAATPIIHQPQVAILDLEAVVKRVVVVADAEGNDTIAIRPMACLCMSWDHRALDGALAAQFLSAVKRRVESLR